LTDKVDRAKESIYDNVDILDINTVDGLNYNMDYLGDYIQDIKDSIQSIVNYNLLDINNLSSNEIQNLADIWETTFIQNDVSIINEQAETIKNQLIDVDTFADTFSFENILYYLEEQLYNFKINNRNLIILDTWKNNILSDLVNSKNTYYSIQ
jgi:hypothetical protein